MSEPRAQLHVGSAQDLFAGLAHPDDAVRCSVLQAVSIHPAHAISLGPWNDQDLVGRIIEMARYDPSVLVRISAVKVAAGFRGPRVLDFLLERLAVLAEAQLVLELEPRLAVEPADAIRTGLLPLLDEPARRPAASLVAARLLSADDGLTPAQRLRVALLSDRDATPPALDAAAEEAWVAELNGSLAEAARGLAAEQGDAVLRLWKYWDRLADATRVWLLAWTVDRHPDTVCAAIPSLAGAPLGPEAACALLRCLPALDLDPGALGPHAAALLHHENARVRAQAVEAGLGDDVDLAAWMQDASQDPTVRMAALKRHARRVGGQALDPILSILSDPDWRMRAAAADTLVALGDPVWDRVAVVLAEPSKEARTTAARVLLALRGEAALEQALRATQQVETLS